MVLAGALLLSLLTSGAQAGPPDWATHDTQRLEGKRYRAVCSGEAPSLSSARQEAVDSCVASAALHLPRELTVRSMSVTSETDGAWHQEVSGRSRVAGLVCNPKQEKIEEMDSSVKVWMLCEFDLSIARARKVNASDAAYGLDPNHLVPALLPELDRSHDRVLTLAIVPACSSLIVSGGSPARIVRCDRNPVSVIVRPGDREVLVRSKGRLPKRFRLRKLNQARQYAKIILPPAG